MVAVAFLVSICAAVCFGQVPNFPFGGGPCDSDWDCSLGGVCTSSKCVCDVWWTGPQCTFLNLQPAESLSSQGLQVPNYFSWGGHPVQDANGEYHLFASFMCDHASLDQWTTKSSVAHATSAKPEGPFVFPPGLDKQLVVPPWSHGAYIVRDPPTQKYLLWHLGDGRIDPKTFSPCYNSSQSSVDGTFPDVHIRETDAAVPPRSTLAPGQRQAFVEVADSVLGPWTSFNNNTGVTVSFPPGSWTNSIDNPAPYIFENGTTLLFFRSETCPKNWGALAPACIGVARADTWQGPYTSLFTEPITHPEGEDPAVFQDPRGNFHMLTNVNTYHARCGAGVPCGGHAWSLDGLTWSNQSVGAFGPVIRFTNGSYFHGAYAERPQVFQAADRTPIAFYMGFGRKSYSDCANWAQLFCTSALDPSKDCGPQQAPPPQRIQPKQNGRCLISNASVFPCAGGWADSCPITLGDCQDPTASWSWLGFSDKDSTLTNLGPHYAGTVTNIDCNSCDAGTIVKVSSRSQYANGLTFSQGKLLANECPGMCLSGVAETHKPPCKAGEWSVPTAVALVPCTDAAAAGWEGF